MITERQIEYLKLSDLHVHTPYCNHAKGRMEDYVRAAIDQSINEIGFLAHAEAGIKYARRTWLSKELLDLYWREGQELQKKYENKIKISLGIELGINPEAIEEMENILSMHSWDRVGLSYHFIYDEEKGIHLNISSSKDPNLSFLKAKDSLEVHVNYYEIILNYLTQFCPFMVCHLDVVKRNLQDLGRTSIVMEKIMQILRVMKVKGIALEINTAGYEYSGELYPADFIIKKAMQLGIPLILCSDSHSPNHVGRHFDRAEQDLKFLLKSLE